MPVAIHRAGILAGAGRFITLYELDINAVRVFYEKEFYMRIRRDDFCRLKSVSHELFPVSFYVIDSESY